MKKNLFSNYNDQESFSKATKIETTLDKRNHLFQYLVASYPQFIHRMMGICISITLRLG